MADALEVMKSVMPKGVEHQGQLAAMASGFGVMKSVMPKGVEHFPHPP